MLYSHLCDLGTWRSIKLWWVLMLFCWLNQRCVLVPLSEQRPHKLNSAYHCINITRIMNGNKKKQPHVREKMVIYSQVASSVYGLHAHKHTRTHTCTYALSHTPVTSGYTVRGCAWGSCFVSPVQTDDWSGRLSGSSNQEWKWSYDSL